jgi:hypothetical protein
MMVVHKNGAAKRQYRKGLPRSGQVTTAAVHPDVWSLALILADGDTSRRQILSRTAVLVRNRGGGAS